MSAFRDALDALRRPLEFAARDGFSHLDVVRGLGPSLHGAAERLAKLVPQRRSAGLTAWARDVGRWDVLPRSERERLIAAGLRLCASAAVDAPAEPKVAPAPPPRTPVTAGLSTPLLGLPGVGPVTAERLAERGLRTVGDLLWFLPRRWDDLRELKPLAALEPGKPQLTRGQVSRVRFIPGFRGRGRILDVTFEDGGATLLARWFHARRGMTERFPVGARFQLLGTPRPNKKTGALEMAHPESFPDENAATGVRARYPEIEGVPARLVEKLCRAACERFAGEALDGLPTELVAERALVAQPDALRSLHLPPADLDGAAIAALNDGVAPAQRRLIYDEFFFLQLGLAKRRGAVRREPGRALNAGSKSVQRFLAALPFSPTRAQRRAVAELAKDLAEPHPMHRLLQGDVGSGKTVVAWAACELACAAGAQAAIMAPTELLAEQHARTLEPWARGAGRSLALLTASTPRPARESTLALAAAGKLDVLVGTHALLAERVAFAELGLVVIDEQHRFGVAQRALLREKGGEIAPHLLVMTATPIPRSLALTLYGDLDVTRLDEMPPGREPPRTKVLHGATGRGRALAVLKEALDEDRQAYWVCPLIEESSSIDFADVTAAADWLRSELDVEVGLVHGRLPTQERDETMRAFRDGRLRVLVATTVIEVGVDVPAASLMVIEGAERFGLAQLHQLRGRIGRGGGRSTCLLVTGSRAGDAGARLAVMAETSDGFEIADADLRIRGPGELFGTRQAGLPRLRFADLLRDQELLRLAREDAFALLERDRDLAAHPSTRAVLEVRWQDEQLFGEEAG